MNYNPDLIRALAHGDDAALNQIKDLSITERMAIGMAVDTLKQAENIVTPSKGISIYEDTSSKHFDYDGIAQAVSDRIQNEKDAAEHKEKIRKEQLEKEVRYKVERSRAGLTY